MNIYSCDHLSEGEVVIIRIIKKCFLVKLKAGEVLHTNKGYVRHDDLIGKPVGSMLLTNLNKPVWVFRPSVSDLIMNVKRLTNISYPKDIAHIIFSLEINSGKRVLEAGTGSGAMTIALASFVSPGGLVVSYERRKEFTEIAKKNIEQAGLLKWVDLRIGDVSEKIDSSEFDAAILDLPEPWACLNNVVDSLKPGGHLAVFLPTITQVEKTIIASSNLPLLKFETIEVLHRSWDIKPNASRPDFRMIGHTGFISITRKLAERT